MSSQGDAGFSEEVIDRVIEILEVKPSDQITKVDGSVITIKEEIWQRLSFIKMRFGDPKHYNDWVAPAKMRKLLKEQHKKIRDALNVLRSLEGMSIENTELTKKPNLVRKWLYEVSEANSIFSAGLVGYDVATFDRNFSTAIESLGKVEGYFSSVLQRAESSVKGRGKTKPENTYADNLLGSLCWLYLDVIGDAPKASLRKDTGMARGKIIELLDYILPELSYPYEKTHYALEKRIRDLKEHEIHGQLWSDGKR